MRIRLIAGVALFVAMLTLPAVHAAAPQMNDFAYGSRLVTPAKASLVKLLIPERIQRDLARRDGADICIFTLEGRLVPHFRPRVGPSDGRFRPLYFEVQANQAYILAYGSTSVPALNPPSGLVQRVDREGARAATVRTGPRIELGGSGRLKQTAAAPSSRLLSLSTLLLGCILLLAFLAWWAARRQLR